MAPNFPLSIFDPLSCTGSQWIVVKVMIQHSLHSVLISDIHTARFPLDYSRAAVCPCTLFRVRCRPYSEGCVVILLNRRSLDADLEDFFQIENVDGETLYVCNICNEGVDNENMIKRHWHENHEDFKNHVQDSDRHAGAGSIKEKTDNKKSFDDYDYYEGLETK